MNRLATSGAWACYAGEYSEKLLQQLSLRFNRDKVQLCCSGTIGVELALRGCKIGPGDEVIMAAYDFPGNFRAIEATGATVVLVDIGEKSWTIESVAELEQAIRPETKGVIVSHLHGTLAPMRAISEWAATQKIALIEDACQAPGAFVDGKPVGSWGDVSVLSFGGSKLLSAVAVEQCDDKQSACRSTNARFPRSRKRCLRHVGASGSRTRTATHGSIPNERGMPKQ